MRQYQKWKLPKHNYLKSLASKKFPILFKPGQPGRHVLTCLWKYSNGVLPVTTLFFGIFFQILRPLQKS